jgi:hypothetical protein
MSTEGPYNYASSSTQRGANEFNFLISRNPGEVLASPVSVESASQTASLRITAADSGSANITTVVPAGTTAPNAVLSLGVASSPAAVSLYYNATQGTDNVIVGRPSVTGVQIVSAISNGGGGEIQMSTSLGTEALYLGANGANFNTVVLGPNGTTTLIKPPSLSSSYNPGYQVIGTVGSGVGVTLTNPAAGAGLYAVMVGTVSNDGPSVAAQASCLAYYNGLVWNLGGCFFGPANGGGNSEIAPTPVTKANLIFKQTSGNNVLGFACSMVPVFLGPLAIPF